MPRYQDYVTLDVFTPIPFAGNQLGVVFLPDDPASFNYSEPILTHPVLADSLNRRRFDIFMTDRELPFAGHLIIGAASWLLYLAPEVSQCLPVDTLVTKAGEITISLRSGSDRIVSASIPFDAYLHKARYPLPELLRLYPSISSAFSTTFGSATRDFPVFSIVKGVNQLFIDLPNLEALESLLPAVSGEEVPTKTASQGGYLDENWGGEGFLAVYFYVHDVQDKATIKPVIRTRMISGALEDAATGSAAGHISPLSKRTTKESFMTMTSSEK